MERVERRLEAPMNVALLRSPLGLVRSVFDSERTLMEEYCVKIVNCFES